MKTRTIGIFVSIIIMSSCKNSVRELSDLPDDKMVHVSGIIENADNLLVQLDRMAPDAFESVDSSRCDEEGYFEFDFSPAGMEFYALKFTEHGYITLIASPGDSIRIKASSESLHPYTVEGSEHSSLLQKLSLKHKSILDQLRIISQKTNELSGLQDFSERKMSLNRRFDSITTSFYDYSEYFIRSNCSSPAILIALYNQYGPGLPVFELPSDLDIYRFVDSCMQIKYSDNEAAAALHSQLAQVESQLKAYSRKTLLKKGMQAPDFVMRNHKGKLLALSDLEGKFVLLQFWASWSKPSVDENPYLKKVHERFPEEQFTILQVSVDNAEADWLSAISEQELEWHHVSDLSRWESAVIELYEIERIPANYLLDPDGKILDKDLFGQDIETAIAKYIDK